MSYEVHVIPNCTTRETHRESNIDGWRSNVSGVGKVLVETFVQIVAVEVPEIMRWYANLIGVAFDLAKQKYVPVALTHRSLGRVLELLDNWQILREKLVIQIVYRRSANDILGANLRERRGLVAFFSAINTFSKCGSVADTNSDGAPLLNDDGIHGSVDEDLATELSDHAGRADADVLSRADSIRSSLEVVCLGDSMGGPGSITRLDGIVSDGMRQNGLQSSKDGVWLNFVRIFWAPVGENNLFSHTEVKYGILNVADCKARHCHEVAGCIRKAKVESRKTARKNEINMGEHLTAR